MDAFWKNIGQNDKIFDVHILVQGHMYVFTPNMKFLCLTMWLGELYTDNADDADNDAGKQRRTKHDCTGSSAFYAKSAKN